MNSKFVSAQEAAAVKQYRHNESAHALVSAPLTDLSLSDRTATRKHVRAFIARRAAELQAELPKAETAVAAAREVTAQAIRQLAEAQANEQAAVARLAQAERDLKEDVEVLRQRLRDHVDPHVRAATGL